MKLPLRLVKSALSLAALGAAAFGCGEPDEPERVCIPGVTQTCSCPGDRVGTQSCVEEGTAFGRCLCPSPDAAVPDAGAPDGWRPDSSSSDLTAQDRTPALDRAVSMDVPRLDRALFDHAVLDVGNVDAGTPDTSLPDSSRADTPLADSSLADTSLPDTSLPDTARPDLAPGVDATAPYDAAGYAGIGESCSGVACAPPLRCTSSSAGGYYCRVPCMPDTGDCDPATESCVNVISVDGGSCVPGSAPPAPCDIDDPPCADLYACAAMTTDFLCRYKCEPRAVDAGCVSGTCYQISGESYGACF